MISKRLYNILTVLAVLLVVACNTKQKNTDQNLPPLAPKQVAVDEYHGQKIEDPYRNLENLEDSTVIDWYKAQGDYAFSQIEKIPGRQQLINHLESYDDKKEFLYRFVRYSSYGRFFYAKKKATEDHYKIYYREQLEGKEVLLFDVQEYVGDQEEYLLSFMKPDWKGNKLAIGFSKKGEEFCDIMVLDINVKKILPGTVKKAITNFATIAWLSDDSGFIYLYSPNNDPKSDQYWMNMRSIVYKIGSDPNKLVDVFSMENNPELKLKPVWSNILIGSHDS